MPTQTTGERVRSLIARAATWDLALDADDFTITNGEVWLDGMDPAEWLDAMTQD